jgi:hypothetical protein
MPFVRSRGCRAGGIEHRQFGGAVEIGVGM